MMQLQATSHKLQGECSVRELLKSGREQLNGSDSAWLDAEVLLAHVLETVREFLYAHPEHEVPPERAAVFRQLIEDRRRLCPVAYLTGSREFRGLSIRVNRHTLIPRPETELLVESALALMPAGMRFRILDLGTGSGAIALAVAEERPMCSITAVDRCPEALRQAQFNQDCLGLSGIRFLQSDWFAALSGEVYDLILCNPPYVSSGDPLLDTSAIRHEPRQALDGGIDGMLDFTRLIPDARNHLQAGGWLMVEHGRDQGGAVRGLFLASGYTGVETNRDYAGHERVTLGIR